jgi:hypothetical protein
MHGQHVIRVHLAEQRLYRQHGRAGFVGCWTRHAWSARTVAHTGKCSARVHSFIALCHATASQRHQHTTASDNK